MDYTETRVGAIPLRAVQQSPDLCTALFAYSPDGFGRRKYCEVAKEREKKRYIFRNLFSGREKFPRQLTKINFPAGKSLSKAFGYINEAFGYISESFVYISETFE